MPRSKTYCLYLRHFLVVLVSLYVGLVEWIISKTCCFPQHDPYMLPLPNLLWQIAVMHSFIDPQDSSYCCQTKLAKAKKCFWLTFKNSCLKNSVLSNEFLSLSRQILFCSFKQNFLMHSSNKFSLMKICIQK